MNVTRDLIRDAGRDAVAIVETMLAKDGQGFRAVILADDDPDYLRFVIGLLAARVATEFTVTADLIPPEMQLADWRETIEDQANQYREQERPA